MLKYNPISRNSARISKETVIQFKYIYIYMQRMQLLNVDYILKKKKVFQK